MMKQTNFKRYRTSFEIPSDWSGQNTKLHLNGINLKSNVWINGHLIVDTTDVAGMFRRFVIQGMNPEPRTTKPKNLMVFGLCGA